MSRNNHHYYFFRLNISYSECIALYEQSLPHAVLTSENGQRIQIPTGRLKQCIDSTGLKGRFRLTVNADNKFVDFVRLST